MPSVELADEFDRNRNEVLSFDRECEIAMSGFGGKRW